MATVAAHYTVSVVVVNANPPVHLSKFISLLGHIVGIAGQVTQQRILRRTVINARHVEDNVNGVKGVKIKPL